MERQEVKLSKRLQTIADMLGPCECVADVGCDHGFVSIYLVQKGTAKRAIAMDVRTGPLEGAKEHVAGAGLTERIQLRLSDGISKLEYGEADALIIAGMGGRLMTEILCKEIEKTTFFQQMILQPQSELPIFRRFLRENGFLIADEKVVFEDGKYYFPMCVVKGKQEEPKSPEELELEDRFGACLLARKEEEFISYLQWEMHTLKSVKEKLQQADSNRCRHRIEEVEDAIAWVEKAMAFRKER